MAGRVVRVHGGVKFYRGAATGARTYLEADRSRADDYYLAEGTGLARRYVATRRPDCDTSASVGTALGHAPAWGERGQELAGGGRPGGASVKVREGGTLDGDAYEAWVAGYDEAGVAKGRLRTDERALRFVEVTVNGPKTWSMAAALHPELAAAYDAAQDKAAREVIGWVAAHATTRVGPRGRQVQVSVSELEAVVVRHYTSRAGDPHRHLHLQINARVRAEDPVRDPAGSGGGGSGTGGGVWRGLHSVGVVDSIEAINGIGHAAVMCDPHLRQVLAEHGYTLDPATGEVRELQPYAGAFSARAGQIARNVDRYEAAWRRDHPGQEPGPRLRRAWDRRAWADARPDKVVPESGEQLARRWVEELAELGYRPPIGQAPLAPTPIAVIDRDAVVDLALTRLGARRSAWNAADIRGEVEKIITTIGPHGVVADSPVRRELAEDLTVRAIDACTPLLDRSDVPGHVRALTSKQVLAVEADLVDRLTTRATAGGDPAALPQTIRSAPGQAPLDPAQQQTVAALAGTGQLVVIEGAAGTGKTTTLAAGATSLESQHRQMLVVTPTLKAAQVASAELAAAGSDAVSAAWLVHQHGFRWDDDGHWTRQQPPPTRNERDPRARLLPGDLLLVDEAGMLDQDTAHALLVIADEQQLRVAFLGDPHQLPAVGRGGVLDHATRWADPAQHATLDAVHRFTDTDYAQLTLQMRTGQDPAAVFDALHARGQIVIHPTDLERHQAVAELAAASPGDLVIADTRETVTALNHTIREHHQRCGSGGLDRGTTVAQAAASVTTDAGHTLGLGDRVATRRNDRDLDVANRDHWIITAATPDGGVEVTGRRGRRVLPADYIRQHLELAYATTAHGAQGETVDRAHLVLGETTGAASAYVAMTRGRHHNTAHLVAESVDDARAQWVDTFGHDRADLGPAHARETALETIDRYGPNDMSAELDHRPERPRRTAPALSTGSTESAFGVTR